jgi:hypothetical protein
VVERCVFGGALQVVMACHPRSNATSTARDPFQVAPAPKQKSPGG